MQHLADLGAIIDDLEAMGRLVRVRSEVDPEFDLAGIAAKFEGGPRAVLFENVKGYSHPVFVGLYWSRDLLGALTRMPEADLPGFVSDSIKKWQREPVHPVVVENGPVLEVTEPDVNLFKLPIPVHALKDGGRYFDAAVVIARDPETGVRNASIQRFMVVDQDTLGVNIDAGRHLELYLEKARKLGKDLPITINVGVGPGLHFSASAPAEAAPADKDELGIVAEFDGTPVDLVPGWLSDVEMVAKAQYALECVLLHDEDQIEGPFAEVTGYYAMRAPRGKVKVKAIHRRKEPVFQTILSGKEVYNSVGLLGEANVLNLLQQQVPGVKDVYFSHGGCGFYGAVVQIQPTRAGWARQAMLAAFAAFPPLKVVTVVDDDVDIRDPSDVEWAMATRLDPRHGIVVLNDIFGHGLNPSFPDYIGNKVGFDATQPYPPRPEFERAKVREVSLDGIEISIPDVRTPVPAEPPPAESPPAEADAEEPIVLTAPAPAEAAPREAGKQQTLVEYILEKTGGQKVEPPAPEPATQEDGGSLVDYILAKTRGLASDSSAISGNGAAASSYGSTVVSGQGESDGSADGKPADEPDPATNKPYSGM